MVLYDFLNSEDKKELETLINSNENLEDKLEKVITFFQKILSTYNNEDSIECLSFFIIKSLFNSYLISFFFIEVFSLRAPYYYGNEEDERKYVVLPSRTLLKLHNNGYDISKIIGGFLQIDHEGDMGYQISQIIEFLIINNFFNNQQLADILKKIIQDDYASCIRIGRFLGTLIRFSVLNSNYVIEIIRILSSDLNLEIKSVSDLLIGATHANISNKIIFNLIGQILSLDTPDLKLLENPCYVSDQVIGLAMIIANYLYENRSLSNLIVFIFNVKASFVLAEAFKYLIDNSIINIKRISTVINENLYNNKLDFSKVALLISKNFSFYEISKFISMIISRGDQNLSLSYENFVKILKGFYDKTYHGFKDADLIQILNNLQKINPKVLEDLEIADYEPILSNIKSENII
ncbi:MAG: hypothetical protein EU532_09380 [Promethearchaeota archaeon]|nr:MAG: hypothetical protein EU532_09380 [Candidatus Lokiarchaeota archaeon]